MSTRAPSGKLRGRQFSLAQLMLCVVICSLFLGIVRLALPEDFVAAYVVIIAAMAAVIGILTLTIRPREN